ncbi:arsenical pump membrane protein [Cutibacterium avidum]|uniref:arsenical pump membrane protein n=1 Tax=Cutibacterium avidum TaxID=33010 RepID=UPI0002CCDE74|nr:arsenical pump membrane protein [Cutibacterium avidum]AGJ77846.1 arsenical pump membrane protein [Cutibacterium avidum 44067]MDU5023568.1 hypothetical protein [Cutibacterium avidum]
MAVLVTVMIFALVRPHGLPEATTAVPGVLLLCLVGTISWSDAGHQVTTMGPTVIFLAAVLALSEPKGSSATPASSWPPTRGPPRIAFCCGSSSWRR